jgi:hypothetical protein
MQFLALLVILAAPPLADDATYQEGVRLYDEFEYERAVFRFEEALRDTTREPAERATIHVRLGMTRAELRDDVRAVQSFQDALLLDPYVTLPADASPKIRALLDEARDRMRAERAQPAAPTPSVVNDVVAPAPQVAAPNPAPAPAPEPTPSSEGSSALLYTGAGLLVVGAVISVVGVVCWGLGTGAALYANTLTYQDEANALVMPSLVGQIGGQVALGIAAVVVAAGLATTVAHVVIGE